MQINSRTNYFNLNKPEQSRALRSSSTVTDFKGCENASVIASVCLAGFQRGAPVVIRSIVRQQRSEFISEQPEITISNALKKLPWTHTHTHIQVTLNMKINLTYIENKIHEVTRVMLHTARARSA